MTERKAKRLLWLALVGGLGAAGYLGTNAWGKFIDMKDALGKSVIAANVQFSFENYIPFVPEAIIAYLLIFPFLLSPIFLVKKYRDFALIAAVYALLVFVSLVIFFRFPTTMARSAVPTHGFVGWLFGIVRGVDGDYNLFPSLHVSSVVYAALVNGFFCPKAKGPSWVCAAAIGVSTLLVKQHAVADVLGGVLFGTAAYIALRVMRRRYQ